MLFINYKGTTPQQRFYNLGVQGNNKVNKIIFSVSRYQEEIDLSNFACNLKIENKEHKYLDLVQLTPSNDISNDTLEFAWEMPLKSTQYRNLELQLEFVDGNELVWQTLIVEIELNETLKVGEETNEKELSIIKQLEAQVQALTNELKKTTWEKTKVEYKNGATEITFPYGVFPLKLEFRDIGLEYYFNYMNSRLLDYQGNELENTVLFSEDNKQITAIIPNIDLSNYDFYGKGGNLMSINYDHDYEWVYLTLNTYEFLNKKGTKLYLHQLIIEGSTFYGVDNNPEQINYENYERLTHLLAFYDGNEYPCFFDWDNDIIFRFASGNFSQVCQVDETSFTSDIVSDY